MNEKKLKLVWSWTWAIVLGLFITLLIRFYLFVPVMVDGSSMMPTLHDGDRVIINRFGNVDRFDVVIFKDEGREYVKRVIGLPGDEITYKNDELYVNGKKQNESYLDTYKKQLGNGLLTDDFSTKDLIPSGVVPKGTVFVLGDNRRASKDSRIMGPIPESKILGTTPICYWPLEHAKFIK
ncbi:type I signal peptidase SipZ [Listeria weihenstephanensis]|uniref:Signal peptidase I n=1 Tax=Listeria weihenstephanensis TaxID=1006155 RepID=A0A1S7FUD6_9LIST|nr:type I signal peptidase SipZ [Listeria weihenstephanensis]AQY50980.1 signal peptidase [Listeria weihenstephanensis]MBC1499922.1 type I signal peptidase SipZ [Listeria weihenstephanensis]